MWLVEGEKAKDCVELLPPLKDRTGCEDYVYKLTHRHKHTETYTTTHPHTHTHESGEESAHSFKFKF